MLLNIEAIIMGTLSMTDSNLYMSAKLIKANDGQVIAMASKECNPSNKDSFSHALMIVANEIAEPTGVLVYKEKLGTDNFGKIQNIIKGYGRNQNGIFNFDTSKGIWEFYASLMPDLMTDKEINKYEESPQINVVKWKTDCANNEKNKFIIKYFNSEVSGLNFGIERGSESIFIVDLHSRFSILQHLFEAILHICLFPYQSLNPA